jgi:hypothetical protein
MITCVVAEINLICVVAEINLICIILFHFFIGMHVIVGTFIWLYYICG